MNGKQNLETKQIKSHVFSSSGIICNLFFLFFIFFFLILTYCMIRYDNLESTSNYVLCHFEVQFEFVTVFHPDYPLIGLLLLSEHT